MDISTLQLLPIHKYPEYKSECCKLINTEWHRSVTARMRSLDASCDSLPTSFVLIDSRDNQLIGHCKVTAIPNRTSACFVESVVIDATKRNCGFGRVLMQKLEEFVNDRLQITAIFLRTRDKIEFYAKLGYSRCKPIALFGNCNGFLTSNLRSQLTYMWKSL